MPAALARRTDSRPSLKRRIRCLTSTEQKPSRRLWIFAGAGRARAASRRRGAGGRAFADRRRRRLARRARDRDRPRTGLAAARGDRPAAGSGYRRVDGFAAARRAEGRGQGNRPAQGHADRDRRCRSGGDQNESKKPKEDDPKIAAVQTQASTESVAAGSDARRRVPRPSRKARARSRRHKAPAKPRAACARPGRRRWWPISTSTSAIRPSSAEGEPRSTFALSLDRLGHVVSTAIEKGSGDAAFDDAAIAMVRRSDPVPPPPPLIADEGSASRCR